MNIMNFIKDDLEIEIRMNQHGELELNLEDVAKGLGFEREKNNKMYVMWDRVNRYLEEVSFHTSVERVSESQESPFVWKNLYIPEWVFYMLCMKAKNEKARKFQLWISKDVLPSLRKNNFYINENEITKEQANKAIDYLLDLCDCGKISLGKASMKIFGDKRELKNRLVNLGYIDFEKCTFKQQEFKASNGNIYPLFVCNMSGIYEEGVAKHQLQVSLTNAGYIWLKDKIEKDNKWGLM